MSKQGKQSAYVQRLEGSKRLIRLGLYRDAVESASGGIEQLMEGLFKELTNQLSVQGEGLKAYNLRERHKKYVADSKRGSSGRSKRGSLGLGGWIGFYAQERLFKELERVFGYDFEHTSKAVLSKIRKLRNSCVHKDYQPTRYKAEFTRTQFALFLEETHRLPQARADNEWTKDWHQEWDERIENWLKQYKDHRKQIVSALADQLRLVMDLIDDEDVPRELKIQLMRAVIYVIEPDDFISEEYQNVHGLFDDAAVIALTLYWLDNNGIIEQETLHEYWRGTGNVIKVINDLYRRIVNNHKNLFSDEAWAVIGAIAKEGPRVLWKNNLRQ